MQEIEDLTKINYKILNPGGNKTAIVIGSEYNMQQRKEINDLILDKNTDVEQVGFIDTKTNRLEMAGGEFCVNATRCAIWQYLDGKQGEIEITVSGYKDKIHGGITEEKNVYVDMNIDKKISSMVQRNGIYNLVALDGILLAVVDEKDSKEYIAKLQENESNAKEELKQIMKEFDTTEKAVGIILLEKISGKTKIHPIIWVKEVDTLYYETACGSGSLATAIYTASREEIKELEVMQPSGYSINISLVKEQDYIQKAIVIGKVMDV